MVAISPALARKTWRTMEPIHGLIYFVPDAGEAYAALGLPPGHGGYFASRAAAMGPVRAEVVGDGHIAALTAEGVSGVEALIIHGATGEVPPAVLRSSRRWPVDEWAVGEESLRSRGWLTEDGRLTEPLSKAIVADPAFGFRNPKA